MAYCLLMDGLAKAGHIREAEAVFEEMKAKNVRTGKFSVEARIPILSFASKGFP